MQQADDEKLPLVRVQSRVPVEWKERIAVETVRTGKTEQQILMEGIKLYFQRKRSKTAGNN